MEGTQTKIYSSRLQNHALGMKMIFGMQMSKFVKWGFGERVGHERVGHFFSLFFAGRSWAIERRLWGIPIGDKMKIITGDERLNGNLSIITIWIKSFKQN